MKWNHLAAAVLIGIGLYTQFRPGISPQLEEVYPVPSQELQVVVASLKQYADKPHAADVARFYADFAWVLERDAGVKTTGQLRNVYQHSIRLFAEKTPIAGSLPGLNKDVDAILEKVLGKEDKPLDRIKTVESFRAIAWGLKL